MRPARGSGAAVRARAERKCAPSSISRLGGLRLAGNLVALPVVAEHRLEALLLLAEAGQLDLGALVAEPALLGMLDDEAVAGAEAAVLVLQLRNLLPRQRL